MTCKSLCRLSHFLLANFSSLACSQGKCLITSTHSLPLWGYQAVNRYGLIIATPILSRDLLFHSTHASPWGQNWFSGKAWVHTLHWALKPVTGSFSLCQGFVITLGSAGKRRPSQFANVCLQPLVLNVYCTQKAMHWVSWVLHYVYFY